jgi:hopanoid biosynthesis associated RND transporter like protein HpnN
LKFRNGIGEKNAEGSGGAVSKALAWWTLTIQKFALVVVLCAVGLTGLAVDYTARNLEMNTSTSDMIDARTPFRRNNDAFDRAFPQFSDLLVIVLDGPNAEATQIAAAGLTQAMVARTDLFDAVTQPGEDGFFKQNGLLYLSEAELAELADRLAAAAPMLSVLAEKPNLAGLFEIFRLAAMNNASGATGAEVESMAPLLAQVAAIMDAQQRGERATLSWRALLSGEKPARAIIVTRPRLDYGGMKPASDAIDAIRAAAAAQGTSPDNGFRLRLTGSVALDHDELESVELGGKAVGLLSLSLVILLLSAGLRSLRLILASIATLLIGLIWTAGFTAAAIGHLNLISVAFAVLFIGLAVDFSLHYCLRFREALATGMDHRAAVVEASRGCGASLTMSAVCAAAGFFAFLPTDYKGLAELGLISGCAMFIALFVNLTVLPALLTLFGGKVLGLPSSHRRFDFARYHRPILLGALGLGVAAAAAASTQLRFDFNPLNLKDAESDSMTAFRDLALDPLTAPYAIDVLTPDLDAALREAARLSKAPGAGDVVTLRSFVPEAQAEKMTIIEDMAFFLAPVIMAPAETGPLKTANLTTASRRSAFEALRDAVSAHKDGAFAPLAQSMKTFAPTAESTTALETRLTA